MEQLVLNKDSFLIMWSPPLKCGIIGILDEFGNLVYGEKRR